MGVMLDKRDREIMVYISGFNARHRGTAPSIVEICKALRFKSTSSVYARLLKLQVAGYIQKEPKTDRSLIITKEGQGYVRGER